MTVQSEPGSTHSMGPADLPFVDLLDETTVSDPYPVYRRLRQMSPVHRTRQGPWLVTRHADAVALLQDRRCSHWGESPGQPGAPAGPPDLAFCLRQLAPVPPTPFRSALLEALSEARLTGYQTELTAEAESLLRGLTGKEQVELMTEFAHPYTFAAISRIIGLPSAKREVLGQLAATLDGRYIGLAAGQPPGQDGKAFLDCLRGIIEERRRSSGGDLLSHLIAVSDSGEVQGWTDECLLRLLIVILYAGHQNMMNFIGNAFLALSGWPEVARRLRERPEEVPGSIAELIRYDSPLQYLLLVANSPLELATARVPAGETILIGVGAANRDPAVFPDPDRLDPDRNSHHQLGFGWGAFRCIGARLAQLEASVALSQLLAWIPDFRVVGGPPRWRRSPFVQRGPQELLVHFPYA